MMKFGTLCENDCDKNDLTKIPDFLKLKMADGRQIRKHRFLLQSQLAVDCLIFTEFCTRMQNPRVLTVECENILSKFGIQDGEQPSS